MKLGLLTAGAVLGAMLMLAGCATQQPQEEQMGTAEEYANYGPWNDPYTHGYGYGYDPYSPFWYTSYPYYYPYYYYPVYPGPWYFPPAPRPPRPQPPIQPKGGGGKRGRRPLVSSGGPAVSPPAAPRSRSSGGPTFRAPSRMGPMRIR